MKNSNLFFSCLLSIPLIATFSMNSADAQTSRHHKVTIDAVEKCLGTTKAAIEKGAKKRPQISCDIPFSFKESELDAMLTGHDEIKDQTEKKEKRIDKASKASVKTLINVRGAKCIAKVRVNTKLIEKAISLKNGELAFERQWVDCTLKTKANKDKKIRFSFTPTGIFENNCLKEFSPKMSTFDLDCTFCRLNFVAHTLRYWVNKIGSRMAPGINKSLGKSSKNCKS